MKKKLNLKNKDEFFFVELILIPAELIARVGV